MVPLVMLPIDPVHTEDDDRVRHNIAHTEALFRTVADYASDWVYWSAPDGEMLYVSPACQRITGYSPEEFSADRELLLKISDSACRSALARHLESERTIGESAPIEFSIVTKVGQLRWIEHVCRPVYDANHCYLGRRASNRDVTDRKRLFELVRQQNALLQAINRVLKEAWACKHEGDFAAICLELALDLTGSNLGWILESKNDGTLDTVASHDSQSGIRPVCNNWERLFTDSKPLTVNSCHSHPDRLGVLQACPPLISLLAVPLQRAASFGMLVVANKAAGFTREDLQALTSLGDAFAEAVVRRRLEESVRSSELRYRRMLAAVTDYVFTVHIRNGLAVETTHSATSEVITGYTPEEFRLDPDLWIRMVPEDERPVVAEYVARVLAGVDPGPLEHRIRRKGGQLRWIRNTPCLQVDGDGALVGYDGLITDITERRGAEMALIESERRLAQAQRIAALGWWEWDIVAGRLIWSDEVYRVFGTSRKDFQPTYDSFIGFMHPDDRICVEESIEKAVRHGVPYNVDHRIVLADGSVRYVNEQGEVIRDARNGSLVMVGTVLDITERKHQESMLAQSRDAAEAADRAKSQFLANMSHEIRTPLTAIIGFTELLAGEVSAPDASEHILTIQRNADHLLGLVNDVLDLSKIESGKMCFNQSWFALAALVAEVQQMFVPVATGKKVRLSIEVEGDIPSEVHTAQEAVHRVLVNLVGNAVKFTSLGEVKIRLQANPLESGRWHIEIAVVDTGIGIEPRVLPKLIRPFVQADPSTTRQFGGTGLGLSIASQLASNIGGRLAVQSTPGVGSTFSFTFEADSRPVRSAADRDREPPDRSLVHQSAPCDIDVLRIDTGVAPPGSGSSFEPTLDGLRVLLVEDCPDNQRFIGLILRKAEAKVTVVENGRQACEQFRVNAAGDQEPYDVVLMDIQMPVMSGLEATSLLRNKGYKVPIIALTANAMESSRDSCLEAGCDDWATKPISKLDLLMLVSRNVAETQKRFDRG